MSKNLPSVGFSSAQFRLIESGIEITGKPTLHEWVEAVEVVKSMVRVSPLALAGLYTYGKSRSEWAEEFYQVVEGYDKRTLENMMSLARKVTPEVLAVSPSIGHADAVRTLPLPRQLEMIQAAKVEQLSVTELRQRVRNERKIPHSAGHASADAERCQRIIVSVRRVIQDLSALTIEATSQDVANACRFLERRFMDAVTTLDAAAVAAIESGIKVKKTKRVKRG